MYTVRASRGKNRLYVRYQGQLTEEEFGRSMEEISVALEQLRPGFDLLADISELSPLPEGCLPGLRHSAELMVVKGVHRAVRVVGRATETALQFERMTRVPGYGANLAYSQEEAERMLDGLPIDSTGF